MSKNTLYDKVWDLHKVQELPNGQDQIYIGLHMLHEVTSPQAFGMIQERGLDVAYPDSNFATTDHIVPTKDRTRPFQDDQAEEMLSALEHNTEQHDIEFFGIDSGKQGIVHVVGPELGLTQPGMTIVCGDSHTSTHGAFGALAMGIGTSQIRDVLATQCIAANRQNVRRIEATGSLGDGVHPKDLILSIIRELGVDGGIGYVYEYAGEAIHEMDMEGRLSVCNMSIEGGARAGYINPDETTYRYLKGREYAPSSDEWDRAVEFWDSLRSGSDAEYDDEVSINADEIEPMVTWGINPGQVIGVTERIPDPADMEEDERVAAEKALKHMDLEPGESMMGTNVDVVFLGSCTNGRLSDLEQAAEILEGRRAAEDVRALAVPGSQTVKRKAEEIGVADVFSDAGFEWREPGCSMCIAMNDDRIDAGELCVSSSNRNYIGRQGSKEGMTVLSSPATLAACAVQGEITDVREMI